MQPLRRFSLGGEVCLTRTRCSRKRYLEWVRRKGRMVAVGPLLFAFPFRAPIVVMNAMAEIESARGVQNELRQIDRRAMAFTRVRIAV